MGVIATGSAGMEMREIVPAEVLAEVSKNLYVWRDGLNYFAEFDGNWTLDAVEDCLEPLFPYIVEGSIWYHCDEGEACANFEDGCFVEEWQQTYYPSELPNAEITSSKRVAQILNIVAEDLIELSDSSRAVEVLLDRCKLTNSEIALYRLEWLEDLQCKN